MYKGKNNITYHHIYIEFIFKRKIFLSITANEAYYSGSKLIKGWFDIKLVIPANGWISFVLEIHFWNKYD